MIDIWNSYYCDNCGYKVVSNCGNPLHGFEKGFDNMQVCEDCLTELEKDANDTDEYVD